MDETRETTGVDDARAVDETTPETAPRVGVAERRARAADRAERDAALAAVLTLTRHAATTAARLAKLRRIGATSDDVYAGVVAEMVTANAMGRPAPTDPASIGRACRAYAARMVRAAGRETPAGLTPTETAPVSQSDADDAAAASRAAVMGRRPRTLGVHRADVYGVGDAARRAMRGADDVYLHRVDTAHRVAAMHSAWTPERDAERDAWRALAETGAPWDAWRFAETRRVDAFGVGYRGLELATYRTTANRPGDVLSWRAMSWAHALPNATPARRAALADAARRWARWVDGAPARAWDAAATAQRVRADVSAMLAERERVGTGAVVPYAAPSRDRVTARETPETAPAPRAVGMLAAAVVAVVADTGRAWHAWRADAAAALRRGAWAPVTRDGAAVVDAAGVVTFRDAGRGVGGVRRYAAPWDAAERGHAARVDADDAAAFATRVAVGRRVLPMLAAAWGVDETPHGLQIRAALRDMTA